MATVDRTTVNRGTVRALNALTARWARAARTENADADADANGNGNSNGGGTVFAAAGVWPLLGLLSEGADPAVRGELTEALGLPPEKAGRAARALLGALDAMDGVDAALGLWTRRELPLYETWSAKLPEGAHARLTGDLEVDAAALDRWARERTGGRIPAMPIDLERRTWLVLASALVLRTRWESPFTEAELRPDSGPWSGRSLAGLFRSSRDLDEVRLAVTPDGDSVTVLTVRGDNGIDVQLLLGEPQLGAGAVLGAGLGLLDGSCAGERGGALPVGAVGPGLSVVEQPSVSPGARVDVTLPRFTVAAEHDLLADAALFGLASATDGSDRRFPGVSPERLALRSARQSATATFDEAGFEAAAVTAGGMAWMSGPPEPRHTATVISVDLDRPFGFLAVHRGVGLVLAGGWVRDVSSAGGV
ncbi:serpin family protein [Streptomyces cavernicola]|uniref:Serpin family protein n=1 Tax=Streptomyces cavernicola TaxID=3043613 RepID=A0ABT6S651_9ACTN|nr:serpin family protein [Streptomyces sp. B-S-A6]MDI3403576.1 serpin family protein [Streptomyces sp. B-S-A6]